jgi:predicted enzyme related to lactoylglutathione lyase
MITGVHSIIYNRQADKLRTFFRDVLSFPFVDAGHDWLIFALPPGELGIHPTREDGSHELYLMCDNLETTLAELQAKGVEVSGEISEQSWGRLAAIKVPGDDILRLYEPRHPTATGDSTRSYSSDSSETATPAAG